MTVSNDQIIKAKNEGLANLETAAVVCDETGAKFYHLCALLEKESGGHNVYGHDAGGALAGFPGTVNKGNYEVFRWLVFVKLQTSNGVGPMQITAKSLLADMEKIGLKPWDAHDNMTYGSQLWIGYYAAARNSGLGVHDAIAKAGAAYNGSTAYGLRLLELMIKWRGIVGSSDYS
jgi:hypothetical protein